MQCMKCGKETEENQVFCKECLKAMEDYPVTITTPVHLPQRVDEPIPKKVPRRKWIVSPEDQISKLKNTVRRLTAVSILLSLVLVIGAGLMAKMLYKTREQLLTGKNYAVETTAVTTEPSETTEPEITTVP